MGDAIMEPEEECIDLDLGNEGGDAAETGDADDDYDSLWCGFCGEKPRCKNQTFGACCRKDVKAAGEQARRRGPADMAAFQALRKHGGPEWIACIRTFKASCSGAGKGWRRKQFDFVAYHMAVQNASRLQKGTKSLWMDGLAFVCFEVGRTGCSREVAGQLFAHKVQSAGKEEAQMASMRF